MPKKLGPPLSLNSFDLEQLLHRPQRNNKKTIADPQKLHAGNYCVTYEEGHRSSGHFSQCAAPSTSPSRVKQEWTSPPVFSFEKLTVTFSNHFS